MKLLELINAISLKDGVRLYAPASENEILDFERKIGFAMPDDFKKFYSVCNGFECEDDIFNFIPLHQIIENADHGEDWFHFCEYMIFSDMWTLRKTNDIYEIVNLNEQELVLTKSLSEFLEHFLVGNVFEEGGLYKWRDTLR